MKKLLLSLSAFLFSATLIFGQDDNIRQAELGISFNLYDLKTAQRIRTTSLSSVLSNKQVAKLRDMSPGLGVHYFKGLKKHIDFAGNFSVAFINYPIANRPNQGNDRLLLTLDATSQFKLTSEDYWLQPFVSAGIGGHKYSSYWGAYIPLGVGMNIDLFNESKLFFNSQYRVPVTTGSSNYHFFHAIGITGVIGKRKEP
ncbi:MAG TPA: hypothetical protein VI548_09125, partial [Chitinophagaceae bacterium]|nr:hypothetical protein [Chitinophagaceae bacterium]